MNNVWNKQDAGGAYSQVIHVKMNGSGLYGSWDWLWSVGTGAIKSYPEIIVGAEPWTPRTSTVSWLPVLLSNLPTITASFSIDQTASNGATKDTTFDLWLCDSSALGSSHIKAEVMIWLNSQNIEPVQDGYIDTYSIGGEAYKLFITNHPGTPEWSLMLFQKVNEINTGSLSLDAFLNLLIDLGNVPSNYYLADIEFGNELVSGSGKTYIVNYSLANG